MARCGTLGSFWRASTRRSRTFASEFENWERPAFELRPSAPERSCPPPNGGQDDLIPTGERNDMSMHVNNSPNLIRLLLAAGLWIAADGAAIADEASSTRSAVAVVE